MEVAGRGRGRRRAAKDNGIGGGSRGDRRALYHCNYCAKDISNTPRIKCAVCMDFDLCLECFSVGVELNAAQPSGHKAWHDYRVIDNLSFPMFHPDWGADEEQLLLEAIDTYGPGNWNAVAEHVGPCKTAAQCKAHYFATYIDVDSFPLPTPAPEVRQFEPGKSQQQPAQSTGPGLVKSEPGTSSQGLPPLHQQQQQQQPPEVSAPPGRRRSRAGTASSENQQQQQAAAASTVIKQEQVSQQQQQPEQQEPSISAAGIKAEGVGASTTSDAGGAMSFAETQPPEGEHLTGAQVAEQQGLKRLRSMHPSIEEKKDPQAGASTAAKGGGSGGAAAAAASVAAADAQSGGRHLAAGQVAGTGLSVAAPAAGPSGAPQQGGKEPKPVVGDATGFNAKRNEFEPEYDHEAEVIIADMEFTENDSPEDRAMKLRILEIYNKRLDERERRRDFLRDYGLLSMRKVQACERRRNAAEREAHARLRVFARYSTPAEHDELVEGLLLEQRLRARIQELKEYRRLGIRTLEDAEAHEAEQKRRKVAAGSTTPGGLPQGAAGVPGLLALPGTDLFAQLGSQSQSQGLLGLPGGGLGDGANGLAGLTNILGLPGLPGSLGDAGSLAAAAAGLNSQATGGAGMGVAGGSQQPSQPQRLGGVPDIAALATANAMAAAQAAKELTSVVHATIPPPGSHKGAAQALASWRARRGVNLDLSCLPGVELLSAKERELCASARLLPVHYLSLKDMMLRDAAKEGAISRNDARNFFRLDGARALRLYELWVANGWVPAPGHKGGAAGQQTNVQSQADELMR